MNYRFKLMLVLFLLLPACKQKTLDVHPGLAIANVGTKQAFFTHNLKPILSFGAMPDIIFHVADDAFDYKKWVDWHVANGMNHVRAYLPLSWKAIEYHTFEHGGSLDNVIFPFVETEPGSRTFDVTKYNDVFWIRFRQQCEYMQSRGIIIHLVMWDASQLEAPVTRSRYREMHDIYWDGHFFNPRNNVNRFTNHLGQRLRYRFSIYHSVAEQRRPLVKATKYWFLKIIDMTADMDNICYDLVGNLSDNQGDWDKTQLWIDEMAMASRLRYKKLQPLKTMVLGFDAGGLDMGDWHKNSTLPGVGSQVDWLFSRPYFDVIICSNANTVQQAHAWQEHYRKPYVGAVLQVDAKPGAAQSFANERQIVRQHLWQFFMAKCQQVDLYFPSMDHVQTSTPDSLAQYDLFRSDAQVMWDVWAKLSDYPNLCNNGVSIDSPTENNYILSSAKEALIYCTDTNFDLENTHAPQLLTIDSLATNNGNYVAYCVSPADSILYSEPVEIRSGNVTLTVPQFQHDIAFLIQKK
ncbi:hypothetical protein JW960_00070 [candidate division KSB1 bacterium]|nr:hypothetical protein [candidate division KSB1 bacterium]